MKKYLIIIFLFVAAFASCKTTKQSSKIVEYKDSLSVFTNSENSNFEIIMLKGKSFNHPTFVIWVEDMQGNFVKTLFITKSYASGIFGHEMINDSVWKKTSGQSYQPAALPYWTNKKGLINGQTLVPTPQNPYIDAYTGATPSSDFVFKTKNSKSEKYRVLVEVNQTWDWNEFWTNNKYPESPAYKHSAQPSIIYCVTIEPQQSEFFLNPIGHGDPKGESGYLFTDLTTLTTAKEIFKSIKVRN